MGDEAITSLSNSKRKGRRDKKKKKKKRGPINYMNKRKAHS
jgi:hypothetical protein